MATKKEIPTDDDLPITPARTRRIEDDTDALDDALSVLGSRERKQSIFEIVREIFSSNRLKAKSVLNQRQVLACAVAYAFADEFEEPLVADIADYLLELKISQGGWGRRDLREILKSISMREQEEDTSRSLKQRLLGG